MPDQGMLAVAAHHNITIYKSAHRHFKVSRFLSSFSSLFLQLSLPLLASAMIALKYDMSYYYHINWCLARKTNVTAICVLTLQVVIYLYVLVPVLFFTERICLFPWFFYFHFFSLFLLAFNPSGSFYWWWPAWDNCKCSRRHATFTAIQLMLVRIVSAGKRYWLL